MAEGMAAMVEEAMETAIGHFDFVLSLGEELDDRFLLAIVLFLEGPLPAEKRRVRRSPDLHRQRKRPGAGLGHPRMAAVMQVLERLAFVSAGQMERGGAHLAGGGERCARPMTM
jgi:hypothetical protein